MEILNPYYQAQTDYERRLRDKCERIIVASIKRSRGKEKRSMIPKSEPEQLKLF